MARSAPPAGLRAASRSDLLPFLAPGTDQLLVHSGEAARCGVCEGGIQDGEPVWPWGGLPRDAVAKLEAEAGCAGTAGQVMAGRRKKDYVHVPCAYQLNGGRLEPPVCKHWARTGACSWQECCFFTHPESCLASVAARAAALEAKAVAAGRGCPRLRNSGPRRRNKLRKDSRACFLRWWLLDNLGEARLGSGSGVLDVAGGKGELSFQLLNLNNLRSTVVEPRPGLELGAFQRKLQYGMYSRNKAFAHYNTAPPPAAPGAAPAHVRMFLTKAIAEAISGRRRAEGVALIAGEMERAKGVRWAARGLEHEASEDEDEGERGGGGGDQGGGGGMDREGGGGDRDFGRGVHGDDEGGSGAWVGEGGGGVHGGDELDGGGGGGGELMCGPAEVYDLLASCSCVVGMHPDQAAEAIADFGLALNKPFALVPCCVYRKQFPGRTHGGREVSSYDDLVAYLMAKDPRVRVEEMRFEGKNKLVYYIPEGCGGSTSSESFSEV